MNYSNSGFNYIDRGFKRNLVLIPGWATDYRIFSRLELDYNYFVPVDIAAYRFKEELLKLLKQRGYKSISILGYSLGGFLASDFAAEYPERVGELILFAVRKAYNNTALSQIKQSLASNAKAFLYKFYLNCFSKGDREGLSWFRNNLLDAYLDNHCPGRLNQGLDYLSSARIDTEKLSCIKEIAIFHGENDLIAPLKEALEIKHALPKARLNLLPGKGHIFFLSGGLKEYFPYG